MRWMLFKVVMFIAACIFVQGAILPWAISNNFMPLWADIALISLILLMWIFAIDRIVSKLMRLTKEIEDRKID